MPLTSTPSALTSPPALPSPPELQRFLDVATEAALAGGAVLQRYYGQLTSVEEKGRQGDLVTNADKESEAAVLAVMARLLPDHAILAEESGQSADAEGNDFLWAIDPLDGTTNYAHQYPFFAVSIGLLFRGQPLVGVVYAPFFKELYQAAKGLGAFCNQQPIAVSATPDLAQSLLVTGFAYDRHQTDDNNYAEFNRLTHLSQGVRRGGSAALDLAFVAAGRLDGYWERGLCPWDLAAGIILVEEAGGCVTAYDQSPFELLSGRILATNGILHQELSQALVETRPLGHPDQYRNT
jgi:myo-inositol-1(or 4)-monophosphatase